MSELTFAAAVKRFRAFSLGPLDLSFRTGITALLGANGAGKTTLMRLAVGAIAPHAGTVLISDAAPTRVPGGVGYLPQDFAVPQRVRTRDYLQFVAWCRSGRQCTISESDVDLALSRVGLMERRQDRLGALSGGMVRRIGIAQALLNASGVLILDEPTVGLDPLQRKEIRELLADLAEEWTILVSTHLSEDVAAIASRVVVLDGGTVRFEGDVEDLIAVAGTAERTGTAVEAGFLAAIAAPTGA